MKRLIIALSASLALLFASACSDDNDDAADDAPTTTEQTSTPTTAAASSQDAAEELDDEPADDPPSEPDTPSPVRGGTFVAAITQDPGHFNPGITTGFNVHAVTGSIFNGLVELAADAQPVPDLADSWDVSDDATQYTFYLNRNARWHDGEEVTAEDVKFTFENILLQYHSRTKGGLENILLSIDTPDDYTVVFNFSQPYSALLQRLNSTEAPILPEHIYAGVEDVQTADENLEPIGSGPFKLDSYSVDEEVVLVRNDDYFKAGQPYVDRVVMRVIPDQNTQVAALESGEVDYIWRLPAPDIARLNDDPGIETHRVSMGPGGGFCLPSLAFNHDRELFQNPLVRQAIAHAIDRDELNEKATFGEGRPATGPISSALSLFYSADVTQYPYDVDRANTLLDEAGYDTEGTRFTIDLLLFPNFATWGEVIREQLSQVGIDVAVTPLDRSAFIPRVFDERDWDTNIISYCNNTDPSIGVARMYLSTNIGNIPFSNAAGYVNERVDELFDAAASTADAVERAALYAEVQQVLTDDLPYVWLVETTNSAGSRAGVQDLQPHSGHFAETVWFN